MPLRHETELRGDERFASNLSAGAGYRFVTVAEAMIMMPQDCEYYDHSEWEPSINRGRPIPPGNLRLPYRTRTPAPALADDPLATITKLVGA